MSTKEQNEPSAATVEILACAVLRLGNEFSAILGMLQASKDEVASVRRRADNVDERATWRVGLADDRIKTIEANVSYACKRIDDIYLRVVNLEVFADGLRNERLAAEQRKAKRTAARRKSRAK